MTGILNHPSMTIDIAVEYNQMGYVELNWSEYKRIGREKLHVKVGGVKTILKVFVYNVQVKRTLEGVPGGFWIRQDKPVGFWKRVDKGEEGDAPL